MTDATRQYLATALWSSTTANGDHLDETYAPDDVSAESIAKAEATVATFLDQCSRWLEDIDDTQAAHDLWLTRNGHGAGFWDGRYSDEATKGLGDYAESLGECQMSEDATGVVVMWGEA